MKIKIQKYVILAVVWCLVKCTTFWTKYIDVLNKIFLILWVSIVNSQLSSLCYQSILYLLLHVLSSVVFLCEFVCAQMATKEPISRHAWPYLISPVLEFSGKLFLFNTVLLLLLLLLTYNYYKVLTTLIAIENKKEYL